MDEDQQGQRHRQANEEFRKAGERIMGQPGVYGGRRAAALVWLLNFAQEDATGHSLGTWADRWEEVKRFAADGGLGPDEAPLSNQRAVRLPGDGSPTGVHSGFPKSRSAADFLLTIRLELKDCLDTYVERGWASIHGITLDLHIQREAPGLSVMTWLRPSFLYQAFHLLGEIGRKIHKCRGCARLFFFGRSDKVWCAGTCQAKTYKREHPGGSKKIARKRQTTTQTGPPKSTTKISGTGKGKRHATKRGAR